jgi:hypothetical protein
VRRARRGLTRRKLTERKLTARSLTGLRLTGGGLTGGGLTGRLCVTLPVSVGALASRDRGRPRRRDAGHGPRSRRQREPPRLAGPVVLGRARLIVVGRRGVGDCDQPHGNGVG